MTRPAVLVALALLVGSCSVGAAEFGEVDDTVDNTADINADNTANPPPAQADPGIVEAGQVVRRSIEVVNTYPHDTTLFTQGLEFVDGLLLESAGGYGRSSLRLYDPVDGTVIATHDVDDTYFAEGVTVTDDQAWQLTWRSGTVLVYDIATTLVAAGELSFDGEGWGLCHFDDHFVMSDGSDRLTFRDLDDFGVQRTLPVTLNEEPVSWLNELECVTTGDASGSTVQLIWANIWKSNLIIGIDPVTGGVTDVVDATALVPPGFEDSSDRVLNGIAAHPETGRLWLTGKEWPVLYEVELLDR